MDSQGGRREHKRQAIQHGGAHRAEDSGLRTARRHIVDCIDYGRKREQNQRHERDEKQEDATRYELFSCSILFSQSILFPPGCAGEFFAERIRDRNEQKKDRHRPASS